MTLRPVGSAAARVALHQSTGSRGYKLLREETDPRSLRDGCVVCVCDLLCMIGESESIRSNPS
jgi:hypothetical protein